VIVGEGLHLAAEALTSGVPVEMALVSPRLLDAAEGRALRERLARAGVALHEASDGTLEALSDARSPQPVIVLVKRRARSLPEVVRGEGGVPLPRRRVRGAGPGEPGSDRPDRGGVRCFGVVATPGSADLFHPRAVRASAGSIFRMPAIEASADDLLREAGGASLALVGADPRGGAAYHAHDWTRPAALLLGGEGAGLPAAVEGRLDARVAIPMRTPVESLSVGAAAAVLLFEAARQRASRAG
jgi:TrmH family RNA methyltransferase